LNSSDGVVTLWIRLRIINEITARTVPKYHTVRTFPKYHTVRIVTKYHTVRTVQSYHTIRTVQTYHRCSNLGFQNYFCDFSEVVRDPI
jgi:hypothetical protein